MRDRNSGEHCPLCSPEAAGLLICPAHHAAGAALGRVGYPPLLTCMFPRILCFLPCVTSHSLLWCYWVCPVVASLFGVLEFNVHAPIARPAALCHPLPALSPVPICWLCWVCPTLHWLTTVFSGEPQRLAFERTRIWAFCPVGHQAPGWPQPTLHFSVHHVMLPTPGRAPGMRTGVTPESLRVV